jgi:hypothetical protein
MMNCMINKCEVYLNWIESKIHITKNSYMNFKFYITKSLNVAIISDVILPVKSTSTQFN